MSDIFIWRCLFNLSLHSAVTPMVLCVYQQIISTNLNLEANFAWGVFLPFSYPSKNSASFLVGYYGPGMYLRGSVSSVRAAALLLGLSVTYAYHMLPPSPLGKMGGFSASLQMIAETVITQAAAMWVSLHLGIKFSICGNRL